MKSLRSAVLAAGLILCAAPALAGAGDDARDSRAARPRAVAIPSQLSASQRENYQAVFADLRAQYWASAAGRLDGMDEGPLHNLARAMLYTMPGSPRVELEPLEALLARAPELPQAADLARLARMRGAETFPDMPRSIASPGSPASPVGPAPGRSAAIPSPTRSSR